MLNILTFEDFKSVMEGIEKELTFQDKLYEVFKEMESDYWRELPSVNVVLMLLDKIFKDESEYPLIDYWVYELDFGKKWKAGVLTEEDGTDIPLKTVSDLYDALVKQFAFKEG